MVTTKDKIQAYILLTVISSLKYVVSKINEYVSEYFLVIYIIYRIVYCVRFASGLLFFPSIDLH